MRILAFVKEIFHSVYLTIGNKSRTPFTFDVKEMKRYVESFAEPRDDIDRSFYQYKCQMKLSGLPMSFCLNIAAFPVLLLFLIKYRRIRHAAASTNDAVFFRDGKPDNILPDNVKDDFDRVVVNPEEGQCWDKKDRKFAFQLLKHHPLSFLYVSKIIYKISRYRYVINKYHPVAIIVCNEYSFTSSALTKFCNDNGIEHINVMHGEKGYNMRDSFFRYNRCYIWDEYYKKLFIRLRADKNQFIISIPRSLVFGRMNIPKTHDYTYYLGNEDDKTLAAIARELEALSRNNRVLVRPHPRYSDKKKVEKYFKNIEIEDCFAVSIEESILGTRYAIALFSTALNQAVHNGTGVVIDDVSDHGRYKKLFEWGYIGIAKPHLLFSQVFDSQGKK